MLDIILLTLVIPLCFWYIGLVSKYLRGWKKAQLKNNAFTDITPNYIHPKVKVLVSLRNEQKVINHLVKSLSDQNIFGFTVEFCLINDHSTDGTMEVLNSIKKDNFKVFDAPDSVSGKKKCFQWLIAQLDADFIVTTDADCVHNKEWLITMIKPLFDANIQFVSGPVLLFPPENIWHRFLQLEFMSLVGIGCSAIYLNEPNMCNGANLAYKRTVFFDVDGYNGNLHIPSGDDEHLMHRIANKYCNGVAFCLDKKAIVKTNPPDSIKSFWLQRKRWVSKSTAYERKEITYTLGTVFLFYFLLALTTIFGILKGGLLIYAAIAIWLAKITIEWLFLRKVAVFFNASKRLRLLIPEQVLHLVYVLVIGIAGNIGGYNWKGRKITK